GGLQAGSDRTTTRLERPIVHRRPWRHDGAAWSAGHLAHARSTHRDRRVHSRQCGGSMKKQLVHLAHARSGDKGDKANIAIFAPARTTYDVLLREVTETRVRT